MGKKKQESGIHYLVLVGNAATYLQMEVLFWWWLSHSALHFLQEIKTSQQAEFLSERSEDEMDLSDAEGDSNEPPGKKKRSEDDDGNLSCAEIDLKIFFL